MALPTSDDRESKKNERPIVCGRRVRGGFIVVMECLAIAAPFTAGTMTLFSPLTTYQ
jgi:hypothetical protein